ncbi:MAG: DUF302 domain-containing protein [Campylobacterales bacterium]|nr:DUF302 domain-containing protein [Campylobacterales bacterium]
MRKILIVGVILFFYGCGNEKGTFLESFESKYDYPTTVEKLKTSIKKEGLEFLGEIDRVKIAKEHNMRLKENSVFLFDNQMAATKLIECNPSFALDLPLRVVIWRGYEGDVHLEYTNPEYWSLKHNIKDKDCLEILNQAVISMKSIAENTTK